MRRGKERGAEPLLFVEAAFVPLPRPLAPVVLTINQLTDRMLQNSAIHHASTSRAGTAYIRFQDRRIVRSIVEAGAAFRPQSEPLIKVGALVMRGDASRVVCVRECHRSPISLSPLLAIADMRCHNS